MNVIQWRPTINIVGFAKGETQYIVAVSEKAKAARTPENKRK
jgi:hypothetical protein